jgi:hypothetical protein
MERCPSAKRPHSSLTCCALVNSPLGSFTTGFPFYNPPSLQADWSPPSQITNTKHKIGCELLALNGHSHDTLSNSPRKQQMQVNSFASNHPITALAENLIPTAAVS